MLSEGLGADYSAPQGADIDAQAEQEMFAAMLGCLTPPELALLGDPDSTEG